jgi:hypothetical protein
MHAACSSLDCGARNPVAIFRFSLLRYFVHLRIPFVRRAPVALVLVAAPFVAGAQGIPVDFSAPNPIRASPTVGDSGLARWIDVQTGTISLRYRRITNSADSVTFNQVQHSEMLRFRFSFDRAAKYTITAGMSSGEAFTSQWQNTGLGTGDAAAVLHFRQLFLTAAPTNGIDFQLGGLGIARGENTEITSYDNDGYLVGGRVELRPRRLPIDLIAATAGHFGGTDLPNVFRRLDRIDDHNYTQFQIAKQFSRGVGTSVGYTTIDEPDRTAILTPVTAVVLGGAPGDTVVIAGKHSGTVRAAVSMRSTRLRFVDLIRFEAYRRVISEPKTGFAIYTERSVGPRVVVGGGFVQIDGRYNGLSNDRFLNADRFGPGRRVYANANVSLAPALSAQLFGQHSLSEGSNFLPNRSRFDVVLTWNARQTLASRLR